jgi:large subunit ribosomal protein L27
MAHTKSQGAVRGNRDSISKRLGLKVSGGQKIVAGNIITRQRGTKIFPGKGTSIGRDFTIFATEEGFVNFKTRQGKKYVEILSQLPKSN